MEIFVYGTLTDPSMVEQVLGDEPFSFNGQAVLEGLHRVECAYPTLMPGGKTPGRILQTDAVELLDRYEGVNQGLYIRQPVPVAEQSTTVDVYLGNPSRLSCDENDWREEQAFADTVSTYITEQNVVLTKTVCE